MTARAIREHVLDGLLQVILKGRSAQDILPRFLTLSDNDRRLAFELFYGSLHHHYELQAIINKRLQKPLKKADADLGIVLALGLYQLRYTRIAKHAALNETVALCHHLRKSWATKLVNAILRGYQRDQETDHEIPFSSADKANLPKWLHQAISEDWPKEASKIFYECHQRAPTTIRINIREITVAEYLTQLNEQEIKFTQHAQHEHAISFERVGDITKLPGYHEGWFSIQDGAAQFAAKILDPKPGERVLDACAAPGGKTSHLLELSNNRASVVAIDNVETRLTRLRENLNRLKLSADVRLGDVLSPDLWHSEEEAIFDKILLDAPCSATGIIRRHPDIALHRRLKDIRVLRQLQWRFLKALWQLLKPGGTLVYSTCSILKAENELLIADFLKQQNEAQLTPFTVGKKAQTKPGLWQIFPGEDDMDGFFYAKLVKQG